MKRLLLLLFVLIMIGCGLFFAGNRFYEWFSDMERTISQKDTKINSLNSIIANKDDTISALRNEIKGLSEETRAQKEALTEKEKALAQLEESVAQLNQTKSDLEIEITNLKSTAATLLETNSTFAEEGGKMAATATNLVEQARKLALYFDALSKNIVDSEYGIGIGFDKADPVKHAEDNKPLPMVDSNGYPVIAIVLKGSPAADSGLEPGKVVEKINDQPTVGWSIDKLSAELTDKPGEKVTLTITGLEEPLVITRRALLVKTE